MFYGACYIISCRREQHKRLTNNNFQLIFGTGCYKIEKSRLAPHKEHKLRKAALAASRTLKIG
jgi:hypothetical protein